MKLYLLHIAQGRLSELTAIISFNSSMGKFFLLALVSSAVAGLVAIREAPATSCAAVKHSCLLVTGISAGDA